MTASPPPAGSQELLTRARAGDRSALNSLIGIYLPRMRRWATRRLPAGARRALDTEDIVQETMAAAVRHLPRLEIADGGALQAYLRRAISNRMTDLYRRYGAGAADAALATDIPDPRPSPLDAVIGAEALERYERALTRLNATDRHAIVLRFELRCDYEAIAAALDKSSAAHARVTVSRAAARLAREMRRAGA